MSREVIAVDTEEAAALAVCCSDEWIVIYLIKPTSFLLEPRALAGKPVRMNRWGHLSPVGGDAV